MTGRLEAWKEVWERNGREGRAHAASFFGDFAHEHGCRLEMRSMTVAGYLSSNFRFTAVFTREIGS